MPEFASSPVVNSFGDPNMLFNSASGITAQQIRQNDLMNQGRQLDLSNANVEQVARVSAALLNIQDPAERAAAYPKYVGMLQSQGYAKNAPATLPDEQTLQLLSRQGTPSQTQAEWAQTLAANKAYLDATGQPPGPTATNGTPTPAAAPGTIEAPALTRATAVRDGLIKRGLDPDTATGFGANALHESSADPNSGPGDKGAAQGIFMWTGPRLAEYQRINGHSPQGAPLDEQLDFVMHELNGSESLARDRINQAQGVDGKAAQISEAYLRPKDTVPEMQRRSATALQLQRQLGGGATAAATPATTTAGGTATPPPYQEASRTPMAPPSTTAAPAATLPPPATTTAAPVTAPTRAATTPPAADATPWDLPGVPAPDLPPPAAPTAAAPSPAVAVPPVATNQVAPGGVNGPPAPTAQPGVRQPPQPPQPPPAAPLPPPPQMPVLNANGLTATQQAQLNAMGGNPQFKTADLIARQQAFVNQNVQLRQQAFSDYMQQQQLAVQQGTLSNAQYEARLKAWQAANPAPTTPRFGEGAAVWNQETKQWEPGTGENASRAVQGHWAVNNLGQATFYPAAARPAQGDYKQQEAAYHFDQPIVQAATVAGQASQNSLIQLNELADLINKGQASGPEGPFRKRVAEFMEQHGFTPDTIKSWTGMSSGTDADLLQKLAVATLSASAKADLGSNVGIQSLELYANANPGLTMLGPANQNVTNMIRVTRAMQDDYTRGLQEHFNTNQDAFLHGAGYNEPVSVYNAKWQQRNNPQIGAAAMGILNGDQYGSWAGRLGGSVEDATNAMKLAVRIDPNATINTGHGQELVKDVLARAGTK